jgi:hypothetical protein
MQTLCNISCHTHTYVCMYVCMYQNTLTNFLPLTVTSYAPPTHRHDLSPVHNVDTTAPCIYWHLLTYHSGDTVWLGYWLPACLTTAVLSKLQKFLPQLHGVTAPKVLNPVSTSSPRCDRIGVSAHIRCAPQAHLMIAADCTSQFTIQPVRSVTQCYGIAFQDNHLAV